MPRRLAQRPEAAITRRRRRPAAPAATARRQAAASAQRRVQRQRTTCGALRRCSAAEAAAACNTAAPCRAAACSLLPATGCGGRRRFVRRAHEAGCRGHTALRSGAVFFRVPGPAFSPQRRVAHARRMAEEAEDQAVAGAAADIDFSVKHPLEHTWCAGAGGDASHALRQHAPPRRRRGVAAAEAGRACFARRTLWFDNPNGRQKQNSYGATLRPVYTFSTVEDFWWCAAPPGAARRSRHPAGVVNPRAPCRRPAPGAAACFSGRRRDTTTALTRALRRGAFAACTITSWRRPS